MNLMSVKLNLHGIQVLSSYVGYLGTRDNRCIAIQLLMNETHYRCNAYSDHADLFQGNTKITNSIILDIFNLYLRGHSFESMNYAISRCQETR